MSAHVGALVGLVIVLVIREVIWRRRLSRRARFLEPTLKDVVDTYFEDGGRAVAVPVPFRMYSDDQQI